MPTGAVIRAELDRPVGQADAVALLLHGFSSGKANKTNRSLAPRLNEAGLATVRLDFRGHYESSGALGEITLSRGSEDALAVMARLVDLAPDLSGLPLHVFGTSFGGAVAIIVARELGADTLALKSPIADIADMQRRLRSRWDWWTWRLRGYVDTPNAGGSIRLRYDFLADGRKYDLVKLVEGLECPVACVHGMRDETVPVEHSRRLVRAAGSRGRLLELGGADHHYSDPRDFEVMIAAIADAMTQVRRC